MSSSEQTVLIVGGGGVPNYGDELILESWLRWYTRQSGVPTPRVRIEGGHHRVLYSLFGDRYPGVKFSSHVRRARIRQDPEFFDSVREGYEFLSQPENRDHPLAGIISGLEVYHLHGGGYLNNRWPTHGFMVGLGLAAKELTGCRLVATGLGLGPLEAPEADDTLSRRAFGQFDLFEVRDDWSHDFLLQNELHSSPARGLDDVFMQRVQAQPSSHKTLHLSLRADAAGYGVVDAVSAGFVGDFNRHVFWTGTSRDLLAFERLSQRFPFFEPKSVHQLMTGFPSGPGDYMVTQRFHPHLIGARAGMQGMYSSGSDYYDVKHGSVVQLGSPFVALDHDLLQKPRATGGSNVLAGRDAALVNQKRSLVAEIAPAAAANSPRAVAQRTARRIGQVASRLRRE
ncbi:polysaccharide pyruvyl transferase family protein [Agrococcus casei]|uniref:polysaccharide pyruvyl transferase family protein n=1 Tax=Agrococcus casei TaxID=343512 RepID=UPI003F9115D7